MLRLETNAEWRVQRLCIARALLRKPRILLLDGAFTRTVECILLTVRGVSRGYQRFGRRK